MAKVETANHHGRMELVFLSGTALNPEDCLRYRNSPIQVQTKEGDVVVSGSADLRVPSL